MWIDRAAGGDRTQRSMLDELGGLPPRVRWAVVCLRLCSWCLSMEGLSPPVEVEVKPNCPAKRHFPGSERWTVGMLARAPRLPDEDYGNTDRQTFFSLTHPPSLRESSMGSWWLLELGL